MLTPKRHQDPGHAARIAGELYGGRVRDNPVLARDVLHATARPALARGYYYQLISAIGWTSLPRLPRLQQPTLILAGDDDPIIPLVNARIMHRLIPRSELHVYHGGHLELAMDAGHLARVVEAFLTAGSGDGTGAAGDEPTGSAGDEPTGSAGDEPTGSAGDEPTGSAGDEPTGSAGDQARFQGLFMTINRVFDHFPGGLRSFESCGVGGLAGLEVLVHVEEMLDFVK